MTTEVLADGARLGDRFVALVGEPVAPGWNPAVELFGPGLPAALVAVGARRGTDSPTVAGTLLFEQYAQRLVAPVLAGLHLDGAVVDARPSVVRVQLADGALRRLAFAHAPRTGDVRARQLVAALEPAAHAVHRHTRVGMRILRGAIANAVASTYPPTATRAASRSAPPSTRPGSSRTARPAPCCRTTPPWPCSPGPPPHTPIAIPGVPTPRTG